MKEKIRIALAQINCKRTDKAKNIKTMEKTVMKAKKQNVNLIIFPELSLTGYVIRDQIYQIAEPIPGPSTKAIENIAKKSKSTHNFRHARTKRKNNSNNL